jgi:hypothetical protein
MVALIDTKAFTRAFLRLVSDSIRACETQPCFHVHNYGSNRFVQTPFQGVLHIEVVHSILRFAYPWRVRFSVPLRFSGGLNIFDFA